MGLSLETLLIGLAFLLPGFLTSSLVISRTPAIIRQPSAFVETFESLLRSVYIHLVIGPISTYFFLKANPPAEEAIGKLIDEGSVAYVSERPIQITLLLFGWLVGALVLATIFGYFWDPLDYLSRRLKLKTGTEANDPWYLLRNYVLSQRKQGHPMHQFWVQARLKNGDTYQGEFAFVSFREEGEGRELLLRHAKFCPNSEQLEEELESPPSYYDAVFLDTANCESIDVLFTGSQLSEVESNRS